VIEKFVIFASPAMFVVTLATLSKVRATRILFSKNNGISF